MSRPKILVRIQSRLTRKMFLKLIWLYVSKPFHISPAHAAAAQLALYSCAAARALCISPATPRE
jgi:hypothetical protein